VEELGHPLLVATDALRQLRGLAIANLVRERLDSRVQGDLDVLLAKLLLSVTQVRLRLAGDGRTSRANLALHRSDSLACDLADGSRDSRDVEAAGCTATELLDPGGDRALVLTRLREV